MKTALSLDDDHMVTQQYNRHGQRFGCWNAQTCFVSLSLAFVNHGWQLFIQSCYLTILWLCCRARWWYIVVGNVLQWDAVYVDLHWNVLHEQTYEFKLLCINWPVLLYPFSSSHVISRPFPVKPNVDPARASWGALHTPWQADQNRTIWPRKVQHCLQVQVNKSCNKLSEPCIRLSLESARQWESSKQWSLCMHLRLDPELGLPCHDSILQHLKL